MAQSFTKNVPLDTDPTLAANSDYISASQKATKTYIGNTSAPISHVTDYNNPHQTTINQIGGTPADGWIAGSGTWTCISTDSPIFNVSISNNATGTIGIGNRIWGTQYGSSKYFIVNGVGITGSTTYLNLYGGTDYTLSATGTSTVTNPYYSHVKAPFGFPVNPDKWSVIVEDTTSYVKSTPTINVWYSAMDAGTLPSIALPIGAWRVFWEALIYGERTTSAYRVVVCGTLSNANNSESDKRFTAFASIAIPAAYTGDVYVYNSVFKEQQLLLTTKATWYFLLRTILSSQTYIGVDNSLTTVLKAVCSYL